MLLALGLLHAGSLHCKVQATRPAKKLNANTIMIPYPITEACIKCLLFYKQLGLSLPGNWHLWLSMDHLA